MDAELAEAGDEDVLAGCYGSLHDFQEGFGHLDGFGLRDAKSVMDAVNDVGFDEAHDEGSYFGSWFLRSS